MGSSLCQHITRASSRPWGVAGMQHTTPGVMHKHTVREIQQEETQKYYTTSRHGDNTHKNPNTLVKSAKNNFKRGACAPPPLRVQPPNPWRGVAPGGGQPQLCWLHGLGGFITHMAATPMHEGLLV